MVVHIVSFKYKAEATPAERADHRAKLKRLADIDGILDFKVGEDIVRSPRSYDTRWCIIAPTALSIASLENSFTKADALRLA